MLGPPHPATSHSRRDTVSLPSFTLSLSSHPPLPLFPIPICFNRVRYHRRPPPWANFASQPISLAVCFVFFYNTAPGWESGGQQWSCEYLPPQHSGALFSERRGVNKLSMDSTGRMNNSGQEGRDELLLLLLLLLSRSKQKDLRNPDTVATLLHP